MNTRWHVLLLYLALGSPVPTSAADGTASAPHHPDAIEQLQTYVNRHIATTPRKMGVVRVLIAPDGHGDYVRLVEFFHPFADLRPKPRQRAQQLDWQDQENVRIRIHVALDGQEWSYEVCHPSLDTSSCRGDTHPHQARIITDFEESSSTCWS